MKESIYSILNISPDAGINEIKHAYRQLALEFHPDINSSPDANEKFLTISNAYELAMEEALRRLGTQAGETVYEAVNDPDIENFLAELRKKAFEAAKRRAGEKAEREKKFEEEFRQSGLYDLTLAGRYLLHFIALLLAPGLILFPVVIAIKSDPAAIFYLFFFWLTGLFLLNYIYSQRKTWFKLGSFYFKFHDIHARISYVNPKPDEVCYYCKNHKADGAPHKHSLLIIKDVILQNRGPLQHQVSYKRDYASITIPRSRKAYLVHLSISCIKTITLLFFLIFAPLQSGVWRFISGLFAAGLISVLILCLTHTRSKVGYLYTPSLLLRGLIWMGVIIVCSDFQGNFRILNGDYMILGITIAAMSLDIIVEPIARLLFAKKRNIPYIKQSNLLMERYSQGYQNCMDVPVWSSLYPLFRWLF